MTQVNPTRMELMRLKERLKTARRGHKLLHDKRDELMRRFLQQVQQARELRDGVEAALVEVDRAMAYAMATLPPEFAEGALLCPRQEIRLTVEEEHWLGVSVPRFSCTAVPGSGGSGVAQTSTALDTALREMETMFARLLRLAQAEKAVEEMALELETTRRRVNVLELVLIPALEGEIRRIAGKLEETERGNLVRLMKVKALVLQQAMEERRVGGA